MQAHEQYRFEYQKDDGLRERARETCERWAEEKCLRQYLEKQERERERERERARADGTGAERVGRDDDEECADNYPIDGHSRYRG